MLRGYRGIFVAVAGLALVSAANQPEKNGNAQPASEQSPPTPPFTPYADFYSTGCYYAQNHDQSDLCAQWRAAVAAEKAAHEARRATFWVIVGVILSLIGLLLILWTLRNEHVAQRPYVFLFRTIKRRHPKTNVILSVEGINFRNIGQSFAYVEALTVRSIADSTCPDPLALPLERYPPSAAIIPNEDWPLKGAIPISPRGTVLDLAPPKPHRLFVYGRMLYRDGYGRRYQLWFSRVYAKGTFAFDPHDLKNLERSEYNDTKMISRLRYWLLRRKFVDRTA